MVTTRIGKQTTTYAHIQDIIKLHENDPGEGNKPRSHTGVHKINI